MDGTRPMYVGTILIKFVHGIFHILFLLEQTLICTFLLSDWLPWLSSPDTGFKMTFSLTM